MKRTTRTLHLKTNRLFKFGREGKPGLPPTDPTITVTATQSTLTTFMRK